MYQAAGIDRRTADAYDRLPENLYLLDSLPAWSSNRLSRLVKRPKRYLADPALAVSAARIDAATVLRDGDLLGRVLDTFVTAQLRPEMTLQHPRTRLYHLRTESGRHEVDLIGGPGRRTWAAAVTSASRSMLCPHQVRATHSISSGCANNSVSNSYAASSSTPDRSHSNSANRSGRCQSAPCGRRSLRES